MQPVRGDEVPSRRPVDDDVVRGLAHRGHRALLDRDAGRGDRVREGRVQDRASYAAARTGTEAGRRAGVRAARVEVVDAGQVVARGVDAEVREVEDGTGHQPLAAGLVDRARSRLVDDDVQAGPVRVQRDGETDRTAAGHHEVTHAPSRPPPEGWPAPGPRPGSAPSAARR